MRRKAHCVHIVFVNIIGSEASMLVQEVANAMRMRLPPDATRQSDLRASGSAGGGAAGVRHAPHLAQRTVRRVRMSWAVD